MVRRHLVAWTACALTLVVAGGTALAASGQENGSAWGARTAPAGNSGHWSAKPAEAPPAAATEKEKTPAKASPDAAKAAPEPARGWQSGQAGRAATPAPAASHWGAQAPPAPEAKSEPKPVVAKAAAHAAPAAKPVVPKKAGKAAAGHTVRTGAARSSPRAGEVVVEWPADLVPPAAPAVQASHTARRVELLWEATPSMEPAAPRPQPRVVEAPKVAAKVEPSKPMPTGLERLSDDWPAWARVSIQYRGRAEYAEPLAPASIGQDGYYLNRVRLQGTFVPASWMQFVVQTQDSQILGYNAAAVSRFANTLDLRLGYAEVTVPFARPMTIRGGRQDLLVGEGRLLGTPDWGNTNRTYDGARASTKTPVGKLDLFAVSPVVVTLGKFDKWKKGEWLYGASTSVETVIPRTVLEPYALVRTQQDVLSEAKVLGDARLLTVGSRAVVKLRKTVEANGDGAVQRGDVAGDTVTAWAAHAGIAWTPANVAMKPKVSAEYNVASGDDAPTDGRRGTFDQLYASNHNRYGLMDAIGWRNMHHAGGLIEASPARKVKVGAGVHYFALATVADGLYSASGTRVILNRAATSRSIGWETDGWASVAISKELSVAAGLGVLFAGDYLQQSSAFDRLWSPYLAWNVKF
jgi:hypothetical protein